MGRSRRSSDGSAEAAGCLIGLATLGLLAVSKALYEVFRYKPQPYRPVAPHVPREGGISYEHKRWIGAGLVWAATGLLVGLAQVNSTLVTSQRQGWMYLAIGAVGLGASYAAYRRGQAARLDVSSLSLTPLYPTQPVTYSIRLPREAMNPAAGVNLLKELLTLCPHLVFQVVGDGEVISWQVVDPIGTVKAQTLMDTIRSQYPRAEVETLPVGLQNTPSTPQVYQQHHFFALANEYPAPILTLDQLKTDDPLIPASKRLDFLRRGSHERIVLTLLTFTTSNLARDRARERFKEGAIGPLSSVPTDREDTNLHGLDERLLNSKLGQPFYHAFLVVTIESETRDRLSELSGIVSSLVGFTQARHNSLIRAGESAVVHTPQAAGVLPDLSRSLFGGDLFSDSAAWKRLLLVLEPRELASLWHLPDERFTADRILWAGVPVPEAARQGGEGQICLGLAAGRGSQPKVYLSGADRAYHLTILGKTGTGKSTLVHNLIAQDIEAGRGVILLDPHGKLVDDVLRTHGTIASDRLVVLNCGQSEQPVPLNPFRLPPGVGQETAFNLIYWVFRKLYESVWRDRMDYVFRSVIQTLLTDPEATPRDISRMLLSGEYRSQVVDALPDEAYSLREFWSWFEAQPKSEQMEIASPILTRTQAFLGNPALEQMTCHPEALDTAAFLREKKVVLFNLSGASIQSESGTLGAFLLAQLFVAAQSLGYLKDGELPRSQVYVDEVERMVTTPLPEMFATARKFGLSLTLANQYMKQLTADTLEGILGNVGTHIVFEVGESDSKSLSRLFEPELPRADLLKLGTYQAAVKTRAQGQSLSPFLIKTLPPPAVMSNGTSSGQVQMASPYTPMTGKAVASWLKKRYQVKKTARKTTGVSSDGLQDFDTP
ncbi:MAG TPA: type IV secretion system DNA-binding domain-containing protein [Aggregatilineales bacterium]|nr:type IV secretion system DNA-binding domain-containing protein [Aggregatilineales bacterium]